MGSLQSKKSISDNYKGVYRVRAKDTAVMKKVWRIIECDLPYYGSTFSTILFRNHPQYMKYFQEDNIPDFVLDARVKKKFSAVCTIVSALFIDYSKKYSQRDHLLGYIAMVHKDMQLLPQDFDNFITDLLEMLTQELPQQMTAECTIVHMRYFGGLLPRIGYFMDVQKKHDPELKAQYEKTLKNSQNCGWLSICEPQPSIYGRPLGYWIAKKSYWELRMAFWSTLDMELLGMASFLFPSKEDNTTNKSRGIRSFPSSILAGNRTHPRSKTVNEVETLSSGSGSFHDDNLRKTFENLAFRRDIENLQSQKILWYERCKKIRKNRDSNFASLKMRWEMNKKKSEMNTQDLGSSIAKQSLKSPRAILEAVKGLKETKINGSNEKTLEKMTRKQSRSVTDRAKKRKKVKTKKSNAIHPTDTNKNVEGKKKSNTTVAILQPEDFGTSVALKMANSGNDKVDPITGLTEKETKIVQSTWALLTKDVVAAGTDVMLSLMDAHPEYQAFFNAFKDVPRDQLPQNKKFQAHGLNVVKAMGVMIDGLTDTSHLVPHLEGLGSRHARRGLTMQQFHKMTIVMLDVLRRNLGKDCTKEVEDTWRKTLEGAWSIMFKNVA